MPVLTPDMSAPYLFDPAAAPRGRERRPPWFAELFFVPPALPPAHCAPHARPDEGSSAHERPPVCPDES